MQSIAWPISHLVNVVHSHSYRIQHRHVVLFGKSALFDLIRVSQPPPIHVLATLSPDPYSPIPLNFHPSLSSTLHIPISRRDAQRISGTASLSTDTLALIQFPTWMYHPIIPFMQWISHIDQPRILILNGITDPGNLGTLFRTASAFGWDGVIIVGQGATDPLQVKSLRAAKGTSLIVPWVKVPSWISFESWCAHFHQVNLLIAQAPSTSDGSEIPNPNSITNTPDFNKSDGPICLVLSNEAHGLTSHPVPCDQLRTSVPNIRIYNVGIPLSGGTCSSLNVAIAGGVLMSHLRNSNLQFISQNS